MKLRHVAFAVSAVFATGAYAADNQAGDVPSRHIEEKSKFSGHELDRQGSAAGAGASTPAEPRTQPQAQQPGMQPDRVTGEVIAVVPQGTLALTPEMVTQVQQQLQQEGYAVGAIDGMWGPRTQQGVLEFQQAEGLEATGQLNEETLAALGIPADAASGGTASGETTERSGPPLPSRHIEEKSKFSGHELDRQGAAAAGAGAQSESGSQSQMPSRQIEEKSKY